MKERNKKMWTLETLREFVSHMSSTLLGQKLYITVEEDKRFTDPKNGKRMYIRIYYHSPCVKTQEMGRWEGKKWYVSEFSTEMEIAMIVKDALLKASEHEVLEGFKFDDIVIINPHISFRKLLEGSPHEEVRTVVNFDV